MNTIHASAVSLQGQGVLILGPSGSGKSTLALELLSLGAQLIADDRVLLHREGDSVIASCPETLRGLIEARGIGILNAEVAEPTRVALVVDLGQAEPDRLPPLRHTHICEVAVPLVLGAGRGHLGVSLRQLLLFGRSA